LRRADRSSISFFISQTSAGQPLIRSSTSSLSPQG
jgi:hypothetical protein